MNVEVSTNRLSSTDKALWNRDKGGRPIRRRAGQKRVGTRRGWGVRGCCRVQGLAGQSTWASSWGGKGSQQEHSGQE